MLLQSTNLPSVTADLTAAPPPPRLLQRKGPEKGRVCFIIWLKRVPNDDSAWKNGSELNSDGLVEEY
jgi:hypothetical protein